MQASSANPFAVNWKLIFLAVSKAFCFTNIRQISGVRLFTSTDFIADTSQQILFTVYAETGEK
jgi:hypothetical protein